MHFRSSGSGSSPVGSAPRKDNCFRFRVKFATTFCLPSSPLLGRNLLSYAMIVGEAKMRKIILEILDVITGHPKRRRIRDGTYFDPAPRGRVNIQRRGEPPYFGHSKSKRSKR